MKIEKIASGQEDDYATRCLLDYSYFKPNNKMFAVDLSKQQLLDAYHGAIQQINFTANLDHTGDARMFFIFEESKETILNFSQELYKNNLIFINIK